MLKTLRNDSLTGALAFRVCFGLIPLRRDRPAIDLISLLQRLVAAQRLAATINIV
jgi:hypothetical protein